MILVVSLLLVCLFLSTLSEGAGQWRAQVIDKETGKPIEGAAVFVRWEKRYTSFVGEMGGNDYYDSEEAVTNADGKFVIGARQTWTLNPLSEIYGPQFFIFKSGYGRWQFRDFDKWWKGDAIEVRDRVRAETRRFTAEGPVLELQPLKTKEERLSLSGDMPLRVPVGSRPKYLEEINRNRQSLGLTAHQSQRIRSGAARFYVNRFLLSSQLTD
jgi:hypothetical protein